MWRMLRRLNRKPSARRSRFVRLGWNSLEQRITPASLLHSLYSPDATPGWRANFGRSVAMNENYRVVGAPDAATHGATQGGQVFVYSQSTNNRVATLSSPLPNRNQFGWSVAISGQYVAVGELNMTGSGSAYVFDLGSPTPSTPIATLTAPLPSSNDYFGIAVAVAGNTVIVGAPREDTAWTDSGSAYVYNLNSPNPTTPTLVLNNPSNPPIQTPEQFGNSVAITGHCAVIQTLRDASGSVGPTYVYDLNSPTPTVPVATMSYPNSSSGDERYCGLATSGSLVAVGLPGFSVPGSVQVFDLNSATPTVPIATLENPAPADGDRFGAAVAMAGSRVVVGAFLDDAGANNSGSAYVFDLSSPTPTVPIFTLNNPAPIVGDDFGIAVAVAGRFVLVGADDKDEGAPNAGATYVYDLTSGNPTSPVAMLSNGSRAYGDTFGSSVALSGSRLAVGIPGDDTLLVGATAGYYSGEARDFGSVNVYDLNSATPETPVFAIHCPEPASVSWGGNKFGRSVALAGIWLVVGEPEVEALSGKAYVFDLASATPTVPAAVLTNPTPADFDLFGSSIAVYGNTVVVGAAGDNTLARDCGIAYVYDLASPTPSTPLFTIDNPTPANDDFFGGAVAVSGNIVVIGAYGDGAGETGAAHVYDLGSATPTIPVATLSSPTPQGVRRFGASVAVSGNYAVIGEPRGSSDGSAYVFDLNSPTPTVPLVVLNNPNPNGIAGEYFGGSVAIDGNIVAVGTPNDSPNAPVTFDGSGTVYIYSLASPTPTLPIETFYNPTPGDSAGGVSGEQFGSSVAVAGGHVAVGAPGDDTQYTDQGGVYVYSLAPRVTNSQVNSGASQRSRVTELKVTFDVQVAFAGSVASAFTLTRTGGGSVTFTATASVVNGVTVVTLSSFTGAETEFGSLRDGNYTLTALAAQISAGGQQMAANYEFGFHRLYGDVNGDRTVNAADFAQFRGAFGTASGQAGYLEFLDLDGDGFINALDFAQFRTRFGSSVP